MTLSLTPDQARAKIEQVDLEMADIRRLASKILERTEAMTASSWQGGRAQMFRGIMQQHHDDFNTVINKLQHDVVEKGRQDISALVNQDTQ